MNESHCCLLLGLMKACTYARVSLPLINGTGNHYETTMNRALTTIHGGADHYKGRLARVTTLNGEFNHHKQALTTLNGVVKHHNK